MLKSLHNFVIGNSEGFKIQVSIVRLFLNKLLYIGCVIHRHRFFHNLPHLCSTRRSASLHTTPSSCWTNRRRLWDRRSPAPVRSATKTDSSQNVYWAVDETAPTLPSGDCVFVDKVVRQSLTSLHSSLSSGKLAMPFFKKYFDKNTKLYF